MCSVCESEPFSPGTECGEGSPDSYTRLHLSIHVRLCAQVTCSVDICIRVSHTAPGACPGQGGPQALRRRDHMGTDGETYKISGDQSAGGEYTAEEETRSVSP